MIFLDIFFLHFNPPPPLFRIRFDLLVDNIVTRSSVNRKWRITVFAFVTLPHKEDEFVGYCLEENITARSGAYEREGEVLSVAAPAVLRS